MSGSAERSIAEIRERRLEVGEELVDLDVVECGLCGREIDLVHATRPREAYGRWEAHVRDVHGGGDRRA